MRWQIFKVGGGGFLLAVIPKRLLPGVDQATFPTCLSAVI